MSERILILGGGFGGLTAAIELKRLCGDDAQVTVVDRDTDAYIGLAKLWVATGQRSTESCLRDRSAVSAHGVEFVRAGISAVDAGAREVVTTAGSFSADHLVIALGMEVDADGVPGIAEHGLNLYALTGASRIAEALADVRGRILVAVCATPFKCPPAPYEAAMMIRDVVSDRASVEVTTPEPRPMPVLPAEIGERVQTMLADRDIAFAPNAKLVEAAAGAARYEDGTERPFDLLVVIPPHRAVPVLAEAGLTEPPGLIPVDRHTLATGHDGVYAIGDCAKVLTLTENPVPRAGILAERQGLVVAQNIAAGIRGQEPSARFDGRGYCFIEVGEGKAVKAEGEFLADPHPVARMEAPSEEGLAEKLAFEAERLKAWFG